MNDTMHYSFLHYLVIGALINDDNKISGLRVAAIRYISKYDSYIRNSKCIVHPCCISHLPYWDIPMCLLSRANLNNYDGNTRSILGFSLVPLIKNNKLVSKNILLPINAGPAFNTDEYYLIDYMGNLLTDTVPENAIISKITGAQMKDEYITENTDPEVVMDNLANIEWVFSADKNGIPAQKFDMTRLSSVLYMSDRAPAIQFGETSFSNSIISSDIKRKCECSTIVFPDKLLSLYLSGYYYDDLTHLKLPSMVYGDTSIAAAFIVLKEPLVIRSARFTNVSIIAPYCPVIEVEGTAISGDIHGYAALYPLYSDLRDIKPQVINLKADTRLNIKISDIELSEVNITVGSPHYNISSCQVSLEFNRVHLLGNINFTKLGTIPLHSLHLALDNMGTTDWTFLPECAEELDMFINYTPDIKLHTDKQLGDIIAHITNCTFVDCDFTCNSLSALIDNTDIVDYSDCQVKGTFKVEVASIRSYPGLSIGSILRLIVPHCDTLEIDCQFLTSDDIIVLPHKIGHVVLTNTEGLIPENVPQVYTCSENMKHFKKLSLYNRNNLGKLSTNLDFIYAELDKFKAEYK